MTDERFERELQRRLSRSTRPSVLGPAGRAARAVWGTRWLLLAVAALGFVWLRSAPAPGRVEGDLALLDAGVSDLAAMFDALDAESRRTRASGRLARWADEQPRRPLEVSPACATDVSAPCELRRSDEPDDAEAEAARRGGRAALARLRGLVAAPDAPRPDGLDRLLSRSADRDARAWSDQTRDASREMPAVDEALAAWMRQLAGALLAASRSDVDAITSDKELLARATYLQQGAATLRRLERINDVKAAGAAFASARLAPAFEALAHAPEGAAASVRARIAAEGFALAAKAARAAAERVATAPADAGTKRD